MTEERRGCGGAVLLLLLLLMVVVVVAAAQRGVEEVDVARREPDRLDLAQLVGRQRRHDAAQASERLVERLRARAFPLVRRRAWRRRRRRRRRHRRGHVTGSHVTGCREVGAVVAVPDCAGRRLQVSTSAFTGAVDRVRRSSNDVARQPAAVPTDATYIDIALGYYF